MSLFDAHSHLQLDPIYNDIDNIIQKAKDNDVKRIIVCGVNVGDDWNRVQEISNTYNDIIIPSYGIHPWYINRVPMEMIEDNNNINNNNVFCCSNDNICISINNNSNNNNLGHNNNWEDVLIDLISRNLNAHIGEVGLDKNIKKKTPMDIQINILIKHIRIAKRFERVLSLHCVGAWGKLLDTLKVELINNDTSSKNVIGILLHSCNSLPINLVQEFKSLSVPVYFSLNGKISNEDMKTMIKVIPINFLLVETDSPDQLIPSLAKMDIKYNEPSYLINTVRIIADVLNISTDELTNITMINTNTLFKLI
jgi:TatD DNase family protein